MPQEMGRGARRARDLDVRVRHLCTMLWRVLVTAAKMSGA
jgi:hypothetical protein